MDGAWHYLHCLKMLVVIANGLLDSSSPVQIDQISQMIYFLSRSIFLKLSDDGVKKIVGFIFQVHRAGVAIKKSNKSPADIQIRTIVEFLVPIVEPMRESVINSTGEKFKILFNDRVGSIYIWLQRLLLQQVLLHTPEELKEAWNEYRKYKKSIESRESGRSKRSIESGESRKSREPKKQRREGGSNKKKRSSKKSKKSKKSGRNKKVRAIKKSRRNKKM